MYDPVINHEWDFVAAVRKAWARYAGGVAGMARRTNVLRTWGNVVGRKRALGDIDYFIQHSGSAKEAARRLGMSSSTLRNLRRYFESLPLVAEQQQEVSVERLIDSALHSGESDSVEFKAAMPKQSRDLAKEVAAFASSSGGLILIGVADDGKVVGFEDPRQRVEGVVQLVSPVPRVQVLINQLGDKSICSMQVAEGDHPVYYVDNRPYVRDGSLSRPASPDEVVRLVRGKTESVASNA